MTSVLAISLDSTLLDGGIGNSLSRHREYAERVDALDVVVCARGARAGFDRTATAALRVRATESRTRLHYVRDGLRIARLLESERAHTVVTTQDAFLTGVIGVQLKRQLGIPLIVQDHSSVFGSPNFLSERVLNRALYLLARRVIHYADAVRVVNTAEGEACVGIGVPRERIHVIPVATPLRPFMQAVRTADWRRRLQLDDDDRVALWVGRAVPVKNLPLLIDAFADAHRAVPRARLVLAGDMSSSEIPGLVERLGLTDAVRFAGPVPHDELAGLYRAADVYVHSSRYEGLGLVLVEAAASALPLISTTTDGTRDVIRDGVTGVLTEHRRDALSRAMVDLLQDTAKAEIMGRAAQADVLVRFDPEVLSNRWTSLWHEVSARSVHRRDSGAGL